MRYVCPECGAKIKYWEEFLFYKKRDINPETGKYGRIAKTIPEELGDMCGFECTECNWSINVVNEECPEGFEDILWAITKLKYGKLGDEVK